MFVKGFTLLELLLTLAVLAVGLNVAVFTNRDFNDRRLFVSDTATVMRALQFARTYALLSQRTVSLCPSADGLSCNGKNYADGWLVFSERPATANATLDVTDPSERVLSVQAALSQQIQIVARNLKHIRFLPNGRSSRAGRLVVCHTSNPLYRIAAIVTTGGLIRRDTVSDANGCET